MRIYVVLSLSGEEMENVYVDTDEAKVSALQLTDFEDCDALFVEIWEEGSKIDDYRLI